MRTPKNDGLFYIPYPYKFHQSKIFQGFCRSNYMSQGNFYTLDQHHSYFRKHIHQYLTSQCGDFMIYEKFYLAIFVNINYFFAILPLEINTIF